MLRCYIASAISKGDLYENIKESLAAFWELQKAGIAPFCPILSVYTGQHQLFGDAVTCKAERMPNGTDALDWLKLDLAWVVVSDCVLRLPGESRGAELEVFISKQLGIPVFYSVEDLIKQKQSVELTNSDWREYYGMRRFYE